MKCNELRLGALSILLGAMLCAANFVQVQNTKSDSPSAANANLNSSADPTVSPGIEPQESDESSDVQDYWIGVSCSETSELLRAHLNITGGLAIDDVAAPSPALTAGLRKYDVILAIDEQSLESTEALHGCIQKALGKSLAMDLIRGGKSLSISVIPELRPPCELYDPIVFALDFTESLDPQQLADLKGCIDAKAGSTHRPVLLLRPGVILERGEVPASSNPGDGVGAVNSPNGVRFHLTMKDFQEDAILFDQADFKDGQAISGCCMKLFRVIGEEIQVIDEKLEILHSELAAAEESGSEVNKLEQQILILEQKRETFIDARDLLNSRIEEQPESGEPESDPGQSFRMEFRLRKWT